MFELPQWVLAVSLSGTQVCLQRKEQAVAMATLLPERWREFISQG